MESFLGRGGWGAAREREGRMGSREGREEKEGAFPQDGRENSCPKGAKGKGSNCFGGIGWRLGEIIVGS